MICEMCDIMIFVGDVHGFQVFCFLPSSVSQDELGQLGHNRRFRSSIATFSNSQDHGY